MWIDDNLRVLRGINSGCVDLVATDPPFNSKRLYNAPLGSDAAGAQFDDTWTMDSVKEEWAELQEAANPNLFHTIVGAGLTAGDSMQAYLSFMAPRLIECHRILKPTGSLYLHCDPHASHYLKQLLDAIFGNRCLNEIAWKRTSTKSLGARRFARDSDRILYYAKSAERTWNQQYRPHDPEYVKKNYRYDDDDGLGKYRLSDLSGGKQGGPAAYMPFNGAFPPSGRAWAPPRRDKLPPSAAAKLPSDYEELDALAKCHALNEAGLIYWSKNDMPSLKNYLSTKRGNPASDIIIHIPPVSGNEKTDWPTQKPLALYEQLISASTNLGDLVFDPFAGCATTMVAAERIGRQWAGVDVDEVATGITLKRLQEHADGTAFLDLSTQTVTLPSKPPTRTDADAPQRSSNIRVILWQGLGFGERRPCNGCDRKKYYDDFHLDHIEPRSKGGLDIDANLQLLCAARNNRKGNRLTMSQLRASWGLPQKEHEQPLASG